MSVDSDIESEETVREEYELFLYGFTVDDFIDDSKFFIKKKLSKKLDKYKDYIIKDLDKRNLEQQVKNKQEFEEKLKMTLNSIGDRCFALIKIEMEDDSIPYIKKKLTIPDDVLLFVNKEQVDDELIDYTLEDLDKLEKEILGLETQIHQNAVFIKSLHDESKSYQHVIKDYEDTKALLEDCKNQQKNILAIKNLLNHPNFNAQ